MQYRDFPTVQFSTMSEHYGSTTTTTATTTAKNNGDGGANPASFVPPKQTFSISEPNGAGGHEDDAATPLRSAGARAADGVVSAICCCTPCRRALVGPSSSSGGGKDGDGFKIIVISMFVFAVAVTVALVFQIISGVSPSAHSADATASDHPNCTEVGDRVMATGGNAVDAAVAASFCLAAVAPHLTGVGGGGVMLIHKHRENKTVIIDFRETTPENSKHESRASTGASSVGVPGFVSGLALAHAKHGSGHRGLECCSWSQLVRPGINVGYHIAATESLVNASTSKVNPQELTQSEAQYLEELIFPEGHDLSVDTMLYDLKIYQSALGILETLARDGPETFYRGALGQALVRELDGVITEEDLANYRAVERKAVQIRIGNYQVVSSPAPTSGPQLLAFLNAMDDYRSRYGVTPIDAEYLRNITQVLERTGSLFLGLGDPAGDENVSKRTKLLLDKRNANRFLNQVEGEALGFESEYPLSEPASAHVATMDRTDIYVSVVTSLNAWFGSKVMTSTGILLNNALSNFAFPADSATTSFSSSNVMSRERRPLALWAPALAVDVEDICGQRVVVGGAGPDTVGQVLVDSVVFGHDLSASIRRGRLHVPPPSGGGNDGPKVLVEGADVGEDALPAAAVSAAFGPGGYADLRLPYTTVDGVDKVKDRTLPVEDPRGGSGGGSDGHRRRTQSRLQ